MSEHQIIIDLETMKPHWVCNAPQDSACHAEWFCDCETIPDYQCVGGVPSHAADSSEFYTWGKATERHEGSFSTGCNLEDWFDEQEECMTGAVVVDVEPQFDFDCVEFVAKSARLEGATK